MGVAVGVGEAEAVSDGDADGVGAELLVGVANKVFWPKTTNAEMAMTATTIIPAVMSIFLFLALVWGLFLPHSGLT
jgi:hypothetical protein